MLGWLSKASGNDSLSLGKSQKSAPVTATISGPFDVWTHALLIMGLRGWGNCAVGIVEITQWLAKLQKYSGLYSFKSEHTFWWHCSWSYRYGTISSENARRCKDNADVSVLRPERIVAKKTLCLAEAQMFVKVANPSCTTVAGVLAVWSERRLDFPSIC